MNETTSTSSNAEHSKSHGFTRLEPFLSPVGAWSYGVGTAIGWGSLVVTSSQYLLQGGPLGSILGIIVGTLIMLFIGRSYAYMMNRYPDSGGTYTYVRHVLGYDYGFLAAWFLVLTYLAVFWANATSLPLFSRFFLGGFFKVGFLYTIFGYDVYAGEVALTMSAIAIVGLLCTQNKRFKANIMIVMAVIFSSCIVLCAGAALIMHGGSGMSFEPALLPDTSLFKLVAAVSLMTPWAFIGFESVSNSVEEFNFDRKHSFKLIFAVVIATGVLYALITLLSVTAYPARYDSWFAYLSDLDNIEGIEGIPPFYAASHYLGNAGIYLLMAALLALVLSSLIGNIVALSRLFVALARDGIVPERLSELNSNGTPHRVVLLITVVSIFIPFLGRTPIGWIVDITTIGAVIVYGLVSLAELHIGRTEANQSKIIAGGVGFGIMALIGLATLLPSLFTDGGLAPETYFLVTVWSILGFFYFRFVIQNDKENVFGKSVVVWAFLLGLIFFTATVWMQKADRITMSQAISSITNYLEVNNPTIELSREEGFIQQQLDWVNQANLMSTLITAGMLALAVSMMFANNALMRKREEERELELSNVKDIAYKDPLTGVKSKAAFLEWEHGIDLQMKLAEIEPFVIIVCDVNGLKNINDTLGHAAGDEYIKQACSIICNYFKHSPVFRIGGDEFVVTPQGEDFDNFQTILAAFDAEIEGNIGTDRAVVSAGYSISRPGLDGAFHDVFERADARMYQRKMQLKSMGAITRD